MSNKCGDCALYKTGACANYNTIEDDLCDMFLSTDEYEKISGVEE